MFEFFEKNLGFGCDIFLSHCFEFFSFSRSITAHFLTTPINSAMNFLFILVLANVNSIININNKGLRALYHDENNIEESKLFENFTSQTYFSLLSCHACSYFVPESFSSEYSGLVILFPPAKGRWYFGDWRACSIAFINESLFSYKIRSPFVAYLATDSKIPQHEVGGLPTLAYSKRIKSNVIAMPW